MATTLEELNRKILKEAVENASVQDRLRGVTASEILKVVSHDEILKGLSREEIEAYLRQLQTARDDCAACQDDRGI